jgi:hypothetical protein
MTAHEKAAQLTQAQKQALIWLAENDHWKSAWTVQGRAVKRQAPDTWSHLRISGKTDILIEKSDMGALSDLIIEECSRQRMWVLTPLGEQVYSIIRDQTTEMEPSHSSPSPSAARGQ